jgi:hypothetical protein
MAEWQPLVEPIQICSQGGVLEATLTAAPHRLQIAETELPGFFYNGSYLPPLWRVRLGDIMRVRLRNELTEGFTNLHFHGMSVSPRGRSGNVFIHLLPGREFHYEVMVPRAGRQESGPRRRVHRYRDGSLRAAGLSRARGGIREVHDEETEGDRSATRIDAW